jgi:pyrroline-5-carboxylate reductase
MGKLLLVGCGKMGGAMLDGWLTRGLPASDAIVAEPVESLRPRKPGLRAVASTSEVRETPEIVVLAVKPQTMDAALADLKRFADEGAVFLSIAAGKTLRYFASHLGTTAKVVRAMPNTPAAVRQGITVATAAKGVSATERKKCQELLEAVGQALWVDDEAGRPMFSCWSRRWPPRAPSLALPPTWPCSLPVRL